MSAENYFSWPEMLEEDDFDFDYDTFRYFIDDDSSDSPSGTSPPPGTEDQEPDMTSKKRRIRNRRRIYAPRIVKNDVRRLYAEMTANVYNSCDDNMYASFMKTFAVPDMRMRKSVQLELPTNKSFQDSFRREVIGDIGSGQKWSMMHFAVFKELCPDNVMRVLSSQLLTRSDTTKTLMIMKVRFDFTRLHDVHPLLFTEDMFETLEESPPKEGATDVATTSSRQDMRLSANRANPFDYYKQKVGSEVPRLRTPQQISFTSTIRVYINECKRVEVIDMSEAEFVEPTGHHGC
jgi:hypothetical protein